MKKVLIVDPNAYFTSDIESRLLISDYPIDIVTSNETENIDGQVREMGADLVAVSAVGLASRQEWEMDADVRSYASTSSGMEAAADAGVACFGVVRTAEELIQAIIHDDVVEIETKEPKEKRKSETKKEEDRRPKNKPQNQRPDQKKQTPSAKRERPEMRRNNQNDRRVQEENAHSPREEERVMVHSKRKDIRADEEDILGALEEDIQDRNTQKSYPLSPGKLSVAKSQQKRKPVRKEYYEEEVEEFEEYADDYEYEDEPTYEDGADEYVEEERPARRPVRHEERTERSAQGNRRPRRREVEEYDEEELYEDEEAYEDEEGYEEEPQKRPARRSERREDTSGLLRERVQKKREEERRASADMSEARAKFEKDVAETKEPAHVITVYSAKGGVGKTTISGELATYLARTAHGRGTYRVCIVDYNIDFGDVTNTLKFDRQKACMTLWAAEIDEQLANGKKKEDIQFTKLQIESFLQKNEVSGLYALLAPKTNEDSMLITGDALEVMLNNLIQNGEFDYIICDTGNNTRDSSLLALQRADDVLLVLTQDINTASCNERSLDTLYNYNWMDMNKIKLIINKVRSEKAAGVGLQDLLDFLKNPETGKAYPCAAMIRENNKVALAGNYGIPLVLTSGNKFTKSIGELAASLIDNTSVLPEPEQKSFFKRKR